MSLKQSNAKKVKSILHIPPRAKSERHMDADPYSSPKIQFTLIIQYNYFHEDWHFCGQRVLMFFSHQNENR